MKQLTKEMSTPPSLNQENMNYYLILAATELYYFDSNYSWLAWCWSFSWALCCGWTSASNVVTIYMGFEWKVPFLVETVYVRSLMPTNQSLPETQKHGVYLQSVLHCTAPSIWCPCFTLMSLTKLHVSLDSLEFVFIFCWNQVGSVNDLNFNTLGHLSLQPNPESVSNQTGHFLFWFESKVVQKGAWGLWGGGSGDEAK